MDENCVFCKIISGKIPSKKEYEDDLCLAFHDINPRAKTHLLIIPKRHIETIKDMRDSDEPTMGRMLKVARDLAKKFGLNDYKLQISVGELGGQEVFHVHMHLLSAPN